jgi:hypothetical protein
MFNQARLSASRCLPFGKVMASQPAAYRIANAPITTTKNRFVHVRVNVGACAAAVNAIKRRGNGPKAPLARYDAILRKPRLAQT